MTSTRSFVRDTAVIASGLVAGVLVSLALAPTLGRLYPPAAMGVWTLFMTCGNVISAFAGLRYDVAILVAREEGDAERLLPLTMLINALLVAISLVLVACFRTRLCQTLGVPQLANWCWWIPLAVGLAATAQSLSSWALRKSLFQVISRTRMGQTGSTALSQIGAAFALGGFPGLILGGLLGQLLGTVYLGWKCGGRYRGSAPEGRDCSLQALWKAARTYRNFPLYSLPYNLLNLLRDSTLNLLLAFMAGPQTLGRYAFAYRVMFGPLALLINSISPIFLQRAAAAEEIRELEPLVNDILSSLVDVFTPLFVLFALEARPIFTLLFGAGWADASRYAVIFSMPAYGYLLTGWAERIFDACGRQRLALILEVAHATATLSAFMLAAHLSHEVWWGIVCSCVAAALYSVVWLYCAFTAVAYQRSALGWLALRAITLAVASYGAYRGILRLLPTVPAIAVLALILAVYLWKRARRWPR